MPPHSFTKDKFVSDLRASMNTVKEHPELTQTGSAAIYGMVGKVPSSSILDLFLKTLMSKVYTKKNNSPVNPAGFI